MALPSLCSIQGIPLAPAVTPKAGLQSPPVAQQRQRNYLALVSPANVDLNRIFLFFGAFALGVISGLRSMTVLAVIGWGARWGWLDLHSTSLAFLGRPLFVDVISAFA